MSESSPGKNIENKRRKVIIMSVRAPVEVLSTVSNKEKGCLSAIQFLRKVKEDVMSDAEYNITNPDADYVKFHKNGNCEMEHWEGLFGILRRSGYSQIEIQSVLMDDLPNPSDERSRSEIVKKYITLTTEALNTVYATDK